MAERAESFVVLAESRTHQGRGASRRLRRAGKVPGILYGGENAPENIAVNLNELRKHLSTEAFYSHVLTIECGDQRQRAVLKSLQRHPVHAENILHLDLQRVRDDQKLRMHVPIHFKGADIAPGIKTGRGVLEHHLIQIEVECLPADLPEYLEIDISALQVGESVHLSDLALPENVDSVELKHGNDLPIAAIHLPRAAIETEEEQPEEGIDGEPSKPSETPDSPSGGEG